MSRIVRILRKGNSKEIFPYGKYKGRKISSVAQVMPSYVAWFASHINDFDIGFENKNIVKEIYKHSIRQLKNVKIPPSLTYQLKVYMILKQMWMEWIKWDLKNVLKEKTL